MASAHRSRSSSLGWSISVGLLALLVALPLLTVVGLALTPTQDLWSHLLSTVLPDYMANTLLLGFGVSAGVLLMGVPLAWMVSVYDFPGRRVLDWALFLPLAMPT
ncbi:MAG: iron ABC transporter permease, partial [Alphaproteobacteria bacterium]